MIWRIYIIGFAAAYFLLWGYFSDWSPDRMLFWEGHDPHIPSVFGGYAWWFTPALTRVSVGFIVFLAAFFTILSTEHKS